MRRPLHPTAAPASQHRGSPLAVVHAVATGQATTSSTRAEGITPPTPEGGLMKESMPVDLPTASKPFCICAREERFHQRTAACDALEAIGREADAPAVSTLTAKKVREDDMVVLDTAGQGAVGGRPMPGSAQAAVPDSESPAASVPRRIVVRALPNPSLVLVLPRETRDATGTSLDERRGPAQAASNDVDETDVDEVRWESGFMQLQHALDRCDEDGSGRIAWAVAQRVTRQYTLLYSLDLDLLLPAAGLVCGASRPDDHVFLLELLSALRACRARQVVDL